jgi:hypothetical protein
MLAIQVEQLAHELNRPGAAPADLTHVVAFLHSLPSDLKPSAAHMKSQWLPYLETRLLQLAGSGTHVGPERP